MTTDIPIDKCASDDTWWKLMEFERSFISQLESTLFQSVNICLRDGVLQLKCGFLDIFRDFCYILGRYLIMGDAEPSEKQPKLEEYFTSYEDLEVSPPESYFKSLTCERNVLKIRRGKCFQSNFEMFSQNRRFSERLPNVDSASNYDF